MTRAFFIGRFQPLHRGHHHAIEAAMERYDIVLGIGSAQASGTRDNPLSADERTRVLRGCFPDIETVTIPDQHDNEAWLDLMEETVDFDVGISGNDLVRRLLRSRGYTVEDPDMRDPDRFSGTAIRERIAAGEDWRDRVPDCALDPLEDVGFAERVRSAYESDG